MTDEPDREPARRPPPPRPTPRRLLPPSMMRMRLRALLATPMGRQHIILGKEILDLPVALRRDHPGPPLAGGR